MGGFGGIVGHAAAGFEQARQQDLSRQFADEQNRRAMAGELFHTLTLDENQHPDVRNASLQAYLGLAQTPPNKSYDFSKAMKPVFDVMAQRRAQAQGQPGQAVPPAGAGPSAPPTPPSGMSTAPTGTSTPSVSMPPAPPSAQGGEGSVFATPSEVTANLTQRAGGVAGGQLTGQMEARKAQYAGLPGFSNLPPETQAVLISGGSLLPLARTVGTGGGFAGQLRAQGYPVPTNIKDDQWVDTKQLMGGQTTFTPGAAPGQKAGEGGTLLNPLEMERQKQAIDLPFYQKKIGMQLAKSLQLQQNAFSLGIQSGNLKQADQIYMQNWNDLKQRQGALSLMEQNYQQAIQPGPPHQQAMVSLLFNHIGMTSGAVKGTRMNRANIEEAMQSTPWISGVIAKWFHQDANGDYIFDGLKGGINLTKPQMEQMMELARDRVAVQRQVLNNMATTPGFSAEEAVPPGVAAIGGFTATPKKVTPTAPPAPPSSTDPYEGRTAIGPNGHRIKRAGGKWVDAQTGAPVQ